MSAAARERNGLVITVSLYLRAGFEGRLAMEQNGDSIVCNHRKKALACQ
jgi:hypothetical protein